MAAFEVKYKYGEEYGMMIALCANEDEIPLCLKAYGKEGAEITSIRSPRIPIEPYLEKHNANK